MNTVDRIRVLANKEGMSLPELEKKLGLGNGTISRWKTSAPSSDKLIKVADYFDVSIDYLLGRETPDTEIIHKVKVMTRKAEEHLTKEESEQLVKLYTDTVTMFLKSKGIDIINE